MEPKNAMAEPDILGTARKAELFDELLKTFEEFMEDEDVYEILRSMMTDQEIIKSGFPFKHNDAEQQALAVLEQLGGQAEPGIPANTAKLRDLLRIHLPDEAYLEHRSTAVGFALHRRHRPGGYHTRQVGRLEGHSKRRYRPNFPRSLWCPH